MAATRLLKTHGAGHDLNKGVGWDELLPRGGGGGGDQHKTFGVYDGQDEEKLTCT